MGFNQNPILKRLGYYNNKEEEQYTNPYDDGSVWDIQDEPQSYSSSYPGQAKNSMLERLGYYDKPEEQYDPLQGERNELKYVSNQLNKLGVDPEAPKVKETKSPLQNVLKGLEVAFAPVASIGNALSGAMDETMRQKDRDTQSIKDNLKSSGLLDKYGVDVVSVKDYNPKTDTKITTRLGEEIAVRKKDGSKITAKEGIDIQLDGSKVKEDKSSFLKDTGSILKQGWKSFVGTYKGAFKDDYSDTVDFGTMYRNMSKRDNISQVGTTKMMEAPGYALAKTVGGLFGEVSEETANAWGNIVADIGSSVMTGNVTDIDGAGKMLKYLSKSDEIEEINKFADITKAKQLAQKSVKYDDFVERFKGDNYSDKVIKSMYDDFVDNYAQELSNSVKKNMGGITDAEMKNIKVFGNDVSYESLQKLNANKLQSNLAKVGLSLYSPVGALMNNPITNKLGKTEIGKALNSTLNSTIKGGKFNDQVNNMIDNPTKALEYADQILSQGLDSRIMKSRIGKLEENLQKVIDDNDIDKQLITNALETPTKEVTEEVIQKYNRINPQFVKEVYSYNSKEYDEFIEATEKRLKDIDIETYEGNAKQEVAKLQRQLDIAKTVVNNKTINFAEELKANGIEDVARYQDRFDTILNSDIDKLTKQLEGNEELAIKLKKSAENVLANVDEKIPGMSKYYSAKMNIPDKVQYQENYNDMKAPEYDVKSTDDKIQIEYTGSKFVSKKSMKEESKRLKKENPVEKTKKVEKKIKVSKEVEEVKSGELHDMQHKLSDVKANPELAKYKEDSILASTKEKVNEKLKELEIKLPSEYKNKLETMTLRDLSKIENILTNKGKFRYELSEKFKVLTGQTDMTIQDIEKEIFLSANQRAKGKKAMQLKINKNYRNKLNSLNSKRKLYKELENKKKLTEAQQKRMIKLEDEIKSLEKETSKIKLAKNIEMSYLDDNTPLRKMIKDNKNREISYKELNSYMKEKGVFEDVYEMFDTHINKAPNDNWNPDDIKVIPDKNIKAFMNELEKYLGIKISNSDKKKLKNALMLEPKYTGDTRAKIMKFVTEEKRKELEILSSDEITLLQAIHENQRLYMGDIKDIMEENRRMARRDMDSFDPNQYDKINMESKESIENAKDIERTPEGKEYSGNLDTVEETFGGIVKVEKDLQSFINKLKSGDKLDITDFTNSHSIKDLRDYLNDLTNRYYSEEMDNELIKVLGGMKDELEVDYGSLRKQLVDEHKKQLANVKDEYIPSLFELHINNEYPGIVKQAQWNKKKGDVVNDLPGLSKEYFEKQYQAMYAKYGVDTDTRHLNKEAKEQAKIRIEKEKLENTNQKPVLGEVAVEGNKLPVEETKPVESPVEPNKAIEESTVTIDEPEVVKNAPLKTTIPGYKGLFFKTPTGELVINENVDISKAFIPDDLLGTRIHLTDDLGRKGRYGNAELNIDGTHTIRLNINDPKDSEFVILHELGHSLDKFSKEERLAIVGNLATTIRELPPTQQKRMLTVMNKIKDDISTKNLIANGSLTSYVFGSIKKNTDLGGKELYAHWYALMNHSEIGGDFKKILGKKRVAKLEQFFMDNPNRMIEEVKTLERKGLIEGLSEELEYYNNRLKNVANYEDSISKIEKEKATLFEKKSKYATTETMEEYVKNYPEEAEEVMKRVPMYQEVEGVFEQVRDLGYKQHLNEKELALFNEFSDTLKKIAKEEGFEQEGNVITNYVMHMLNPNIVKEDEVIKLARANGFDIPLNVLKEPFNIHNLSRKMKGTIEEINDKSTKVIGHKLFEDNIARLMYGRIVHHEKFMFKKNALDKIVDSGLSMEYIPNFNSYANDVENIWDMAKDKLDGIFTDSIDESGFATRVPFEKAELERLKKGRNITNYDLMKELISKPEIIYQKVKNTTELEYKDFLDLYKKANNDPKQFVINYINSIPEDIKSVEIDNRTAMLEKVVKDFIDIKEFNPNEIARKKVIDAGISASDYIYKNNVTPKIPLKADDNRVMKDIKDEFDSEYQKLRYEMYPKVSNLSENQQRKLKTAIDDMLEKKYPREEYLKVGHTEVLTYKEVWAEAMRITKFDGSGNMSYENIKKQYDRLIGEYKNDPHKYELVYEKNPVDWQETYYKNMYKKANEDDYILVKTNDKDRVKTVKERTVSDKGIEDALDTRMLLGELMDSNLESIDGYSIVKGTDIDYKEFKVKMNDDYRLVDRRAWETYMKEQDKMNKTDKSMMLKMYDTITNAFKIQALFSGRYLRNNAIGNYTQSMFTTGVNMANPKLISKARKIRKGKDFVIKVGDKQYTSKQIKDYMEMNSILTTQISSEMDGIGFLNGNKDILAKKTPLQKTMSKLNPTKALYNVSEAMEEEAKIMNFISHLENGLSMQEAGELTNKALFDYSDLTDFETKYMKRLIPFYTFMRKNIPLQLDNIANRTGQYSRLARFYTNASRGLESDQEYALRPDYMESSLPIGDGKYLNLSLPMFELDKLQDPKGLLSSLNPIIKTPLELLTNKQLYSGYDISRNDKLSEKLQYAVESMNPSLKNVNSFNKMLKPNSEEEYNKAMGEVMNFLGFISPTEFDLTKAQKSSMEAYVKQLQNQYYEILEDNPLIKEQIEEERKKPKERKSDKQLKSLYNPSPLSKMLGY